MQNFRGRDEMLWQRVKDAKISEDKHEKKCYDHNLGMLLMEYIIKEGYFCVACRHWFKKSIV
jgi:hypothetical protein